MADWGVLHLAFYVLAVGLCALTGRRSGAAAGLVLATGLLALCCGLGIAEAGKTFSLGFAAAAAEPGIAVLTAALVGMIAAAAGAPGRVARLSRQNRLAALVTPAFGLLAGAGASPAMGLAFSLRLAAWSGGRVRSLGLALAANAAHGLVLPAPPLIAATVILGADWRLVLAIGLPLAVAVAFAASALAASLPDGIPAPQVQATAVASGEPASDKNTGADASLAEAFADPAAAASAYATPRSDTTRATAGMFAATFLPLVLLAVSAAGDIPSEPLGGGATRELILGLGRPLLLLVASLAAMLLITGRRGFKALAQAGAADAALRRAAPLVIVLALAGALQAIGQETRTAETLAERIAGQDWGLFAPFLMAAGFRALQASPLTAAIATAGILQPAFAPPLADSGLLHASVALAIGAGSISLVNVNDAIFWLAAAAARLRIGPALLWITLASAMQGFAVLGVLWLIERIATVAQ